MDDTILIELECPVCTNLLSPPIRQCATGHSVCSECFRKLKICALCKREFTDSRNFTLESLALKIRYPCENEYNGCKERLTYAEIEDHHRKCKKGFKLLCAMEGCTFVGDLTELKAHWLTKRTIFRNVQKDVLHLINGQYQVDLIEAFNELFWLKRSCCNDKIYFAMQYIGNPKNSENFYFEVEFCEFNINRNKLKLSHICSNVDISDDMLFSYSCYSSIVGFDSVHSYLATKSHCNDQLPYTLKVFHIDQITKVGFKTNFRKNGGFTEGKCHKKNSQTAKEKSQVVKNSNENLPGRSNDNKSLKVNKNDGDKNNTLLIDL